jgi:hypothetical protein
LATTRPASLYVTFPPAEAKRLADRLEIHYTPKHGSWLNMAELELSVLQRQCLGQRSADRSTMERAIAAWTAAQHRPDHHRLALHDADARIKLRRLYPAFEE